MTYLDIFGEIQIPLLAATLLGAALAKLVRAIRTRSVLVGLGPTSLFPQALRSSVAITVCAAEFGLGVTLVVTAGRFGQGAPAITARSATSLLFVVATAGLLELRESRPGAGCGCFGELSSEPVTYRTIARAALLAVGALATVRLGALRLPGSSEQIAVAIALMAAELAVLAALSPEVRASLVRLGYADPCELRLVASARTVEALHRSKPWRMHSGLITSAQPTDIWRELCWRYVAYSGLLVDRPVELVFAVHLGHRRPLVHAAVVDAHNGELLPWPSRPRRVRPAVPAGVAGPASLPGPRAPGPNWS